MRIGLNPEAEVGDARESPGDRVDGVDQSGELEGGDGDSPLTANVAVTWSFRDEDREEITCMDVKAKAPSQSSGEGGRDLPAK